MFVESVAQIQMAHAAIKKIEKQYRPLIEALTSLTELTDALEHLAKLEKTTLALTQEVAEKEARVAELTEQVDSLATHYNTTLQVQEETLKALYDERLKQLDAEIATKEGVKQSLENVLQTMETEYQARQVEIQTHICEEEKKLDAIKEAVREALARIGG